MTDAQEKAARDAPLGKRVSACVAYVSVTRDARRSLPRPRVAHARDEFAGGFGRQVVKSLRERRAGDGHGLLAAGCSQNRVVAGANGSQRDFDGQRQSATTRADDAGDA